MARYGGLHIALRYVRAARRLHGVLMKPHHAPRHTLYSHPQHHPQVVLNNMVKLIPHGVEKEGHVESKFLQATHNVHFHLR